MSNGIFPVIVCAFLLSGSEFIFKGAARSVERDEENRLLRSESELPGTQLNEPKKDNSEMEARLAEELKRVEEAKQRQRIMSEFEALVRRVASANSPAERALYTRYLQTTIEMMNALDRKHIPSEDDKVAVVIFSEKTFAKYAGVDTSPSSKLLLPGSQTFGSDSTPSFQSQPSLSQYHQGTLSVPVHFPLGSMITTHSSSSPFGGQGGSFTLGQLSGVHPLGQGLTSSRLLKRRK